MDKLDNIRDWLLLSFDLTRGRQYAMPYRASDVSAITNDHILDKA